MFRARLTTPLLLLLLLASAPRPGSAVAQRSSAGVLSGSVAGLRFSGSTLAESAGFIVTTLAGSGTQGFRDGPADSAQFNNPSGIAVDAAGTVYIGDFSQRIRKIAPDGTVSTLAGTEVRGFVDGPGSLAQFDNPVAVAVGSGGEVFVADAGNSRIRKVFPDGTVSTLAGSGAHGFADGPGASAEFSGLFGIAIDASGVVYAEDAANYRVRRITPDGMVSTLAGSGRQGSADGPGQLAEFNFGPTAPGIAVDGAGIVYVADQQNHRVRTITPDGTVSTLAGSGTRGFADGPGASAQFSGLFAIAVDAASTVYIADRLNNRVRTVTPDGTVSTLAGSGEQGFSDGTAGEARFNGPSNLAVDSAGGVYVTDAGNQRIRRVAPGTVETLPPSPLPTNPKK